MVHLNKTTGIADGTIANRNKLHILVYLAAGDREIHKTESDLIREIGIKMGFSDDQLTNAIIEFDKVLTVIIPEEKTEKFSLIYDLLQIMLVDGKVTIEEVAIVSKISFLFGLPAFKLKEFYISLVKANGENEPKEMFLNRMMKML